MVVINLAAFRRLAKHASGRHSVSILIPARNEERSIGAALDAAASTRGAEIEIVVLDDESTDRTAEIVANRAAADPRIRLEHAPPLPTGWSGKQHACWNLAQHARHEMLLFVDADVRLSPDAVARAAAFLESSRASLISGFPHQETGTFAERLVVPLIHFLLLGYLPIPAGRIINSPAFAAGCGQFFLTRRADYFAMGGHSAIRSSLHDGITLPRAFRRRGLRTRLFDATDLATCRMYRASREVWDGFSKNATEGMATPTALPVWTVLLGAAHVIPIVLIFWQPVLAGSTIAIALATRLLLAARFRQSFLSAFLHPLGIAVVLAIQWTALVRALAGRRSAWRGRTYEIGST
jgi:glycosyltransferase involved in cell wall biosynthesis